VSGIIAAVFFTPNRCLGYASAFVIYEPYFLGPRLLWRHDVVFSSVRPLYALFFKTSACGNKKFPLYNDMNWAIPCSSKIGQ
jgi:hypothetical protein